MDKCLCGSTDDVKPEGRDGGLCAKCKNTCMLCGKSKTWQGSTACFKCLLKRYGKCKKCDDPADARPKEHLCYKHAS